MFDAQLSKQVETWKKYWETVTDAQDTERQLQRLRWLEEFAFHCGTEISREQYEGLRQQMESGEAKLAELGGGVPKTPTPAPPQVFDSPRQELPKNGTPETHVFGGRETHA